ncbi:hypothetical protein CDAR_601801 [Caerostris darwini]|uniref:Uncharacterized protein n=1 Tax=Caerostris darwini TaxID=1538125 RepID=A0AAV4MN30_9ARAC|nr:hypothetical protein CDAR_601801 [Caerostris darwini]
MGHISALLNCDLWSKSSFKSIQIKKERKSIFSIKPALTVAHSTIKRHPFLMHSLQLRNSVLEMDPYFTELYSSSSFTTTLNKIQSCRMRTTLVRACFWGDNAKRQGFLEERDRVQGIQERSSTEDRL